MKLFGILLMFFSNVALAEVSVSEPVNAKTDIPGWMDLLTEAVETQKSTGEYPKTGMTDCKEVVELSRAYLCLSYQQVQMNLALTRASFFVEGLAGNPPDTVLPHSDPRVQQYVRLIGGHDLKVSDLLRFYAAVIKACEEATNKEDVCLSQPERDIFGELIFPLAEEEKEAVIITFAVVSSMSFRDVVTHEIMHAQYFLDANYRRVADEFWHNSVLDRDKEEARNTLAEHYNVEDPLLLRNEFQAYILMANAEYSLLGFLVEKYRTPLMQVMTEAGVQPLQVH